ncbi:MAG: TatD family hydrolase [Lachnospiraceae bacterium]|nr:TatD family hydrolase [Lachnospiraceae bacterium]
MYFESHAHYDDSAFDTDRQEILNLLPAFGVEFVVNSASDMPSSRAGIALAEKYDYIYAAIGVHPHEVKNMKEEDLEMLASLSKHQKVVAIGEIGLDYYYDYSPRDAQKYWFEKQLALALMLDMPVIIHSRDAAQETFDIIKESGVKKGVIHCYSGSLEMAKEYVKLGFHIGIGGVLTYKNANTLLTVVKEIPFERILIETDSPYLSPVPNRGKRNDSRNLLYITQKLAEVKNVTHIEAANITLKNAKLLFFHKIVA